MKGKLVFEPKQSDTPGTCHFEHDLAHALSNTWGSDHIKLTVVIVIIGFITVLVKTISDATAKMLPHLSRLFFFSTPTLPT